MLEISIPVDCVSIRYVENSELTLYKLKKKIKQNNSLDTVSVSLIAKDYNEMFSYAYNDSYVNHLNFQLSKLGYYLLDPYKTDGKHSSISTYETTFILNKSDYILLKTKFIEDFQLFKEFLNSGVYQVIIFGKQLNSIITIINCLSFNEFKRFLDHLTIMSLGQDGVLDTIDFKKISKSEFNVTKFEDVIRKITKRCNKSLIFNDISQSYIRFKVDNFSYTNDVILGLL